MSLPWATAWVVARYRSKIGNFNLPTSIWHPHLDDLIKFQKDLWHQKTRVSSYNSVSKAWWQALSVWHKTTDKKTDRQTQTETDRCVTLCCKYATNWVQNTNLTWVKYLNTRHKRSNEWRTDEVSPVLTANALFPLLHFHWWLGGTNDIWPMKTSVQQMPEVLF